METNNKLIAEFMGYHTYESNGYDMVRYSDCNERTLQDTHYHSSWDWLMPVVDKIKILVMEDDSDELYNSEEWDNITHTLVQILFVDSLHLEIKSVYQAVVEFIKDQNN